MPTPIDGGVLNNSAIAANSDNATLVRAGKTWVWGITLTGSTAAIRWFKLYNKATSPTSADTPFYRVAVPGLTTGVVTRIVFEKPLQFDSGLGLRCVTGQADNDNTAVTAGDVVWDLEYSY